MKIHLLGPSGSGTSTLGVKLANFYQIPFFDTDDIFWIRTDPPFQEKRKTEMRKELLQKIVNENTNLVLSGSMLIWGDSYKSSIYSRRK